MSQHALKLVADSLTADHRNLMSFLLDGRQCAGFHKQLIRGRKPDAAKHAELVLFDPFCRIADGSNQTRLQIFLATNEVDDLVLQRVEKHAVDREVTSQRVFSSIGVLDRVRMSTVAVAAITPECGDLDRVKLFTANFLGGGGRQHRDHSE